MRPPRPVLVALLVIGLAPAAHAGDGIVLESYTGARPADASKLLAPMLEELATKNFIGGAEVVGRRFEATVSRDPGSAQGLPADFAERTEKGHRAYFAGKFDEAVGLLGPLVDAAHANTGAFVATPVLRERLLKATISLALAHHRLGDPTAARAAFGELVRGFPDALVARGTYGPDAAALYDKVRKELSAGPRGRLLVKLVDEDDEVFINERLERAGTTVKELIPGDYRVVVRRRGALSRNHRIVIRPDAEVTLTVDHGLDAVVHSAGWFGFEFPTAGDRERTESAYAQAMASALGAGGVIVVGIDLVRDRPAVVGSLVSTVNGRELRRASLPLEPAPSVDRLRALARFLGGEQASADIDVEIGGEPSPTLTAGAAPAPTSSRRWGGWKWITAGVAAGAIATGVTLLALDGTCPGGSTDPSCPDLYNTAAPGWISVGGGAVLAGITVYLFVTSGHRAPARQAYVAPTTGGAIAGFTARF